MMKQKKSIFSYFFITTHLLLSSLFLPQALFAMSTTDKKTFINNFLQRLIDQPEEQPEQLPSNIIKYQDQEFPLTKNVIIYHLTPLMAFAYSNSLNLAQQLLAQSSDPQATVNHANSHSNTPLMLAAQREHKKFVKFLLEQGASPNTVNLQGYSALHFAAQAHNRKIVNLLLRYGADPRLKNKKGETPGDLTKNQAIKNLLATWHAYNSARAFIFDISQDKATHVPPTLTPELLNLPVQFTLKVHGEDTAVKFTPLMVAAYKGDYAIAQQLLQKGVLPDITNDEGTTALTVACNFGDEAIASLLLQYGADINKQDNEGMTCLMYATTRNYQNLVKFLLQRGANEDLVNNDGLTAQELAPTKPQKKGPQTLAIKEKLQQLFQKPTVHPQRTTVESTQKKVPAVQKLIEKLELLKNVLIQLQNQL